MFCLAVVDEDEIVAGSVVLVKGDLHTAKLAKNCQWSFQAWPVAIIFIFTAKNVMNGDPRLYRILEELRIPFEYHEHPPAPTIQEARKYWKGIDSAHCKNLFFRNHKGNRHYLVVIEHSRDLSIHDLEKRLKQGKLTFASDQRMMTYLGLTPGSVTPFGLINDQSHHVHLFLDENLKTAERISFHPCLNTASIVLRYSDFQRFLEWTGNTYEYLKLYD
jgi:Ala-tRNA(Pro) deacylase